MSKTVTIPQSYFDTLVGRPAIHSRSGPETKDSVVISKTEYCELVRIISNSVLPLKLTISWQRAEREYNILRNALINGGLSKKTLDVLLSVEPNGNTPSNTVDTGLATPKAQRTSSENTSSPASTTDMLASLSTTPDRHHPDHKPVLVRQTSASSAAQCSTTCDDPRVKSSPAALTTQLGAPKSDKTTISILNLPANTSYRDITSIVRGGRLFDVYIRNDRTANISFIEGAENFLTYAKRKNFYLNGKLLDFEWNTRQKIIPNFVVRKIAHGATRNIVIHAKSSCNQLVPNEKITEEGLRDELEHIHNLHIVSVTSKNGEWYISTNSIANGLFARTCLMSRAKYKSRHIEWYPDECANPIPPLPRTQERPWKTVPAAPVTNDDRRASLGNRYGVLDVADLDDSDSDDSEFVTGVKVSIR